MRTPQRILVATDFSDCSRHAVDVACDVAQALHAELRLVHVWQITPLVVVGLEYSTTDVVVAVESTSQAMLDEEVERVHARIPTAKGHLRTGIVWDAILRVAAEESCDFIVLGTHGRSGLGHALVGSVAEAVVRASTVPVITVPDPLLRRPLDVETAKHELEAKSSAL